MQAVTEVTRDNKRQPSYTVPCFKTTLSVLSHAVRTASFNRFVCLCGEISKRRQVLISAVKVLTVTSVRRRFVDTNCIAVKDLYATSRYQRAGAAKQERRTSVSQPTYIPIGRLSL
jgi:hypothetical protein